MPTARSGAARQAAATDALLRDAERIYGAAVSGVRADRLLRRVDWAALVERDLSSYRAVWLLAAGKAALAMTGAVEGALATRVPAERLRGLAVVPHGYRAPLPAGIRPPRAVEVLEAGHPVPDPAGQAAARHALDVAARAGPDDLVLVLLSGGASSLWSLFAEGIALGDARATFQLLLRSGADIGEMNVVRKHLSLIGGGRLAAAAYPATVRALVVSDVIGDDLSVIGSGPTVPDPTTYADAVRVLWARDLWRHVPASVRAHLELGAAGLAAETPKPEDARLRGVRTTLIGGNADALAAATAEAERLGYTVQVMDGRTDGEARERGRRAALAAAAAAAADGRGPVCLLWGGETTVTVRGTGRGGRNQELALSAALEFERLLAASDGAGTGHEFALLSGGTDGIDGPTDAAGAGITPRTAAAVRARGLDPEASLANNDAYRALDAAGALLRPGPTHTNVMDVQVALVRPRG